MTASANTDRGARGSRAGHASRALARLAAVQALYQMEIAESDAVAVIAQFRAHGFVALGEGLEANETPFEPPEAADMELFERLVSGVVARQSDVDRAVNRHLAAGWRLERIDTMLRALFRSAAFELLTMPEVPARAVIAAYVDLAHAFYGREETGFVNALLDALAREVRADEFGGT